MNRAGGLLVLGTLAFLAIANPDFGTAQPGKAPQPATQTETDGRTHRPIDVPQGLVVCTGWHALCDASPDCRVNGDKADCDCWRVDETHIVETSEIQDAAVKHQTQVRCTNERPCDVDEAPVCMAIEEGKYKVDHVRYDWVSTYSYRGWCSLLPKLTACDLHAPGYAGESIWAICDAAPCTEDPNPPDPDKPLICQCRVVRDTPFVGINGSCTGDGGGIMSSFPLSSWDFDSNTYTLPVPGYEYVQGACAALKSDSLEIAPTETARSH